VISPNRRLALILAVSAAGAFALLTRLSPARWLEPSRPLLLAPMIGVVEPCIFARHPGAGARPDDLALTCTRPEGSAAPLVEATLSALAPAARGPGWELGYTLPIPLLKLFRAEGKDWVIDREAVARFARTLRDTDRPAIVYLFSTHFGVQAPIEEALQADPRNLAVTPDGPLPRDSYYGADIFNWTFASTDTDITRRRAQAMRAVLAEVCQLAPEQRANIRGITLLGELHHLFPQFQTGMGFGARYRVTDYSEASKAGFRAFLQRKYGDIEQLNRAVGGAWTSFDQVEPPAGDIRSAPGIDLTAHIDSYAHGTLPVTGWAYVKRDPNQPAPRVRIYRNGAWIGSAAVGLGRQDVLQALPELGTADTGWRFDLDFRGLEPGLHRLDAFLEERPGDLVHLATRRIAIMGRGQQAPQALPEQALPASRPAGPTLKAYVDLPADQSSYYYNPLVPLWHAWRNQQVVAYLEYFAAIVKESCLAGTDLYTHQIIPFSNPGWDENKYAIDASLQKLPRLRLGVSLYGEPTYGASFTDWFKASGQSSYGVTEFHPMKAMNAAQFGQMLDRHAADGATFISFFLEPRWNGALVARGHNIFSLAPENPRFGSDQLYRAAQGALGGR
jgi:hypothetical protein